MNFISGGKLGDFLHTLWVVSNTPGKHKLYITDRKEYGGDFFSNGLKKTFEELEPIITNQNFIESFSILENPITDYINLNIWRKSRLLFKSNWTKILTETYSITNYKKNSWLKFDNYNPKFKNKVVIHCSLLDERNNLSFPWDEIIIKNNCIFVSSNKNEYDHFGKNIEFYSVKNLWEYFEIINSCNFFVGNQSSPFVIAHSLNVNRLLNISPTIDGRHYIGEENFHNNFSWISSNNSYIENIKNKLF